jgi:hypothetical protein
MERKVYNLRLFEAYIGTPEKYEWYWSAFDAFRERKAKLTWYWNGWAFVGGFWYFLYRKQRAPALGLLVIIVLTWMFLPPVLAMIFSLLGSVAVGGLGTWLVYMDYLSKREDIEAVVKEDEKRIIVMQHQVGGVHRWAIPVGFVSVVLVLTILWGVGSMAY